MIRLRPQRAPRRRGIALLMALAVVMLLTYFLSEYFFATALELRAMTTFKDAQRARMLARSVFKAVELALLQDEVDFFTGYGEISKLLDKGGALPWNDGLVLTLNVQPQDHLFNLNQNYNVQVGQPQDVVRSLIFLNLFDGMEVPSRNAPGVTEPLSPDTVAGLYAAIQDWIDRDSDPYTGFPSVAGAENAAYQGEEVKFEVKNAPLDRLEEIRPIRGVVASGIPWAVWEHTVTVLPKPRASTTPAYLSERINVNTASAAEIQRFLETRRLDPNVGGEGNKVVHDALNKLADNAADIAAYFAPAEGPRKVYTKQDIEAGMKELGLGDVSSYATGNVFSTANQYYRVRIVTEAADVPAHLEAMLHVARDEKTRIGASVEVLWISQD